MISAIASQSRTFRIGYILVLIVAFIGIYSAIFDKKVSLGGDNANYYILGTAIANGEGYVNIHHADKEAHYHYPPGYPVIIAGVIKLFSNDVGSIKIANGIFLLGAILLLFFIVKKLSQNDHIAFAVSGITLLNYHILSYSTIMMSEIPFLFFSLLCIWLFLRIDFSKSVFKNWQFLLLIVLLSFSFYIRSVAIALAGSMMLFLLLKKRWRYLFTLVGGFILLYLPWFFRGMNSTGNTYISQLSLKNPYQPELGTIGIKDIFERIFINAERYITKEIPSGMVSSAEVAYTDISTPMTEWLLGFLLVISIIFGIYKLSKFRVFIALYVLAFFAILLVWPSVWYGTRFMLPLVPILLFLAVFGMIQTVKWLCVNISSKHSKKMVPLVAIVGLSSWSFFYGSASISKLKENATFVYADNYKNYFALADWIQKNAADTSVTAVRKEGLFYLFSKKYVTNFQRTPDREAQIEYLKEKNVRYVVVDQLGYSSTSAYLVPAIDRYPNKFKTVKMLSNPNTYLMKFTPELGYWGDWKDEQRNGFGTYLWEDGQKYEGNWQDNVRHGTGKLYFSNGEVLEGTWTQGKLNGEVVKKDKNGKIIERSMYQNNEKVEVTYEAN
ncbi:glycosyltransferase family 39 protein [Kordia periserrulae]|nr:glycosyltransferase family 39 protein [Kordia periserrulae]